MAKSQIKTAKGDNAQRIYTVTEAANILGMSRRATSEAARAGKLAGIFGGLLGVRLIGITAESVDAVIQYRKAHQPTIGGNGNAPRDAHPAAR